MDFKHRLIQGIRDKFDCLKNSDEGTSLGDLRQYLVAVVVLILLCILDSSYNGLAPYGFAMKHVTVVFSRAELNLRAVALVYINGVSSLMSSTRVIIEGSDIHLLGVELNQNAVAFPDNLHSQKYNILALVPYRSCNNCCHDFMFGCHSVLG